MVKNVIIAVLSVLVLILGGAVVWLLTEHEDVTQGIARTGSGEARVVEVVQAADRDVVYELDATNTQIGFRCNKTVAGRRMAVSGGWRDIGRPPMQSRLSGQIITDEDGRSLKQIQVEIEVGTVWSEHDDLTTALLTGGFFDVDNHPTATFISTGIEPGASAEAGVDDATHTITGNFKLNGIERSISFPARVNVAEGRLELESRFILDRKEFNANFTKELPFAVLTDDDIFNDVAMTVNVDAPRRAGQAEQVAEQTPDTTTPDQAAGGTEPAETVAGLDALPTTFTETIPATQVQFELVLVPGDPQQGIEPFYMGTHEVTWNEFLPWVNMDDVHEDEHGVLRAMLMRPSPPYGDPGRGFGLDNRPAVGMSRMNAERYVEWLSEQTGRNYRLPTEAEWVHAYRLGGGNVDSPPSAEVANQIAVYEDNSFSDEFNDWGSRPVGSREPNELGIFDMAGNAAEWVTDTGEDRVVRGGHFDSPLDQVGGHARLIEDEMWNDGYPNEPKSVWWFFDARWTGFRVVMDPSPELASTTPTN